MWKRISCKRIVISFKFKKYLWLDISRYAINKSPKIIRKNLKIFDARKKINFNKKFDLVISINLIHNFELKEVFSFLKILYRYLTNPIFRPKAIEMKKSFTIYNAGL